MSIAPGTRLGRYEIRQPLGEGGMGEVYRAWDDELEREIAVKVLRGDLQESSDRGRRFVQEAKAASALNHPNVATVHEIGTSGGVRFIAMELVEGETLRRRLARGRMPLDDVLSVASQMAAALAAAHRAGIVHRDIKPENVILRPDGWAKVLDFGLAKLNQVRSQDAETLVRTEPNLVMGTLRYMAPEQLAGSDVGPVADVFSLGVVLYEMVTGVRPFDGITPTDVASAILTREPTPPVDLREDTPPRLAAVMAKALAKKPEDRYPTAAELLEELKSIGRETEATAVGGAGAVLRARGSRRVRIGVIALALAALVVVAAGMVTRSRRITRARESIARAENLVAARRFPDALEAAIAAAEVLPGDPRLPALIARTSTRATIESEPAGAIVYLQRFQGPPERVRAGTTPLTIERLARADYIVTLEKDGYTTVRRPLPVSPQLVRGLELNLEEAKVRARLSATGSLPPEMVLVDGGPYRLTGWSRPSDRMVVLDDFLIDRYEVSNLEYEAFVRDGGYRRRELWKHPFVVDGRTLGFDEAMTRFRDTTGLSGPRSWASGAPVEGTGNHPVTGVSWYEAAAFAAWKGKSLPTVFQWERAARFQMRGGVGSSFPWGVVSEGIDATERSNFGGKGTMAVDSMPFGLSPWGAHHMAGNVAEWCLNQNGAGYAVRGGGWNDAVYTFGRTGAFPPFFAADTVGFRCVKELKAGADQGAFALNPSSAIPDFRPVDDRAFEEIRRRYEYPRTPLEARIVETIDGADWRREKIVYRVGDHDVPAYLYLPKGFRGPLQVIHFAPAGDVAGGYRPVTGSIENSMVPFLRGGRAVFSVVMEGFSERPRTAGDERLDSRSVEYVDFVVAQVTELRRGLDYLETRKDLDTTRIAFYGPSAGSWAGVILTAVEPRYRSVLFMGTDLEANEITDAAAANRINFAPRIAAPKMMLQGRYDESAPLETEAMPLFRLLAEPKRLEIFEGSHVPPLEIAVPIMKRWFDETLGSVNQ